MGIRDVWGDGLVGIYFSLHRKQKYKCLIFQNFKKHSVTAFKSGTGLLLYGKYGHKLYT